MSTWPKNEIQKIAETDDLHISPFREDGKTYGTPTWIWSVVVDDALYVRAYNGQNSRWYKAALRQKDGRISAAGMTREVSFLRCDGGTRSQKHVWYRRIFFPFAGISHYYMENNFRQLTNATPKSRKLVIGRPLKKASHCPSSAGLSDDIG